MSGLGFAGIIAVLIAVVGFWLKGRGGKAASGSEEVLDEYSEKASEAGVDLAAALGASSDERVKSVLDWYRKRTASSGKSSGDSTD